MDLKSDKFIYARKVKGTHLDMYTCSQHMLAENYVSQLLIRLDTCGYLHVPNYVLQPLVYWDMFNLSLAY